MMTKALRSLGCFRLVEKGWMAIVLLVGRLPYAVQGWDSKLD